jgi:hypothetical protein
VTSASPFPPKCGIKQDSRDWLAATWQNAALTVDGDRLTGASSVYKHAGMCVFLTENSPPQAAGLLAQAVRRASSPGFRPCHLCADQAE